MTTNRTFSRAPSIARWTQVLLVGLVLAAVLIGGGYLGVRHVLWPRIDAVRPLLLEQLTQLLGAPVEVFRLDADWVGVNPSVTIEGLSLRDPTGAVVLKPNMAKYVEEGRKVRALMQALTPAVEPLSIDEAFLDLSGLEALHKAAPVQTLARLQRRVFDEIGITVSIGLSFNKFLAKTASDLDKPNGFSIIGRADALDFLAPRSVASLPGVGPAGAKTLAAMGIATIADLRAADVKALIARLGEWGYRLFEFAHARDPRKVDPEGARRSISAETTFGEDIRACDALEDRLWLLCERVAARARASDAAGWTVSLKLKSSDFRTISRARRLNEPTLLASRLFDAGRALLAPEATGRTAFRLIGIGLSDLTPAAQADQGDLADQETPRRAAAEAAIAKARAKFGAGAVKTGRALRIEDED
ncbi:MAG: DNA polymerase IV [Alphaproteobacteria bacterium]|nr:DNA polymerase IV [Alphaproteobacteria bacterium]